MKTFSIRKVSFRNGEAANENLFRFEKERLRDDNIKSLVEETLDLCEGSEVEYGGNIISISIYPEDNKWCYVFEKLTEDIEILSECVCK